MKCRQRWSERHWVPGLAQEYGRVVGASGRARAPAPGGRAALPCASPSPASPTVFSPGPYPDWHFEMISVSEMADLFPCVIATCSTHSKKSSSQPRPNVAHVSVGSVRAARLSSAAGRLPSAVGERGPAERSSVSNGEENCLTRSWYLVHHVR